MTFYAILAARRPLRALQTTPEGATPGLSCATIGAEEISQIFLDDYKTF